MEFSALSNVSVLLISAGLAFFLAAIRVARLARRYRARTEQLLRLGGRDMEPLDFPSAAWSILLECGWRQVTWQGSWYGQAVAGQLGGATGNPPLTFSIGEGETSLTVGMAHASRRGENRLFAEQLARVFILLFEARLRARTEALAAALAERARLSLYLQHDMRNLAQWVMLVSSDFSDCANDEALLAAGRRLRDNALLASERADRLIRALGRSPCDDPPQLLDLRECVEQATRMAGFASEVTGSAHAFASKSLLNRALDNIFSNMASVWRHHRRQALALRLHAAKQAEIEFLAPWPPNQTPLPPERIFEPFASGRPGGLGLGLYQARKSMREAGGELEATPTDEGIRFRLCLPASAP